MSPAERRAQGDARPAGYEGPEGDAELMPQEPPPRVARALSNFLIAVFLGVMGFAAFVPLPESVKCRFVLTPEGGSGPVTSPEAGVVDQVHVKLGQSVTAGQPLMTLRPYVEPGSSPAELRARIERIASERASAEQTDTQLATRHDLRVAELESDLARARAAVVAARGRHDTLVSLTRQLERAAAEGAVSQRELLERRQEAQEAELDLTEAQRSASAAQRQLEAAEAVRAVEIAERELVLKRLAGEEAEARASLVDMSETELGEADPDVISIVAPQDGIVVGMPVELPGTVVNRSQPLVLLTRPDAVLRAEIAIPERGAARITQGQTVRLLFDAYPYTRHGVISGVLNWVSPAAQGGNLAAFARLEDASVIVDDRRRPLLPGMVGEARIDTGSRTLLEYVFEPLQQLREGLRPGSAEAG